MVEIRFKIFLSRAAASLLAVTTARSAPIGAVRLQVVKRGAAIRKASSRPWSTCHTFPQAAGSAGGWPAITVAPVKAGALTRLISVGANRFHVSHRLLDLVSRRRHAPCHPHGQALTARLRLHRCLGYARDTDEAETLYNNSLTSDFSSFNSATDASIFERLKSFIGRLCTISHFPPRTRTGNDEINPFSTP